MLLASLAAIPYLNALADGFVLDDIPIIVRNPIVRQAQIGKAFTTHYWSLGKDLPQGADPGLYRPLALLTYAADHAVWGSAPAGFHLTNLLLHVAATLLVFLLALQLIETRAPACFAAALFAVHPLHTEAVTSIVGRAEILATIFFLLALLISVRPAYGGAGSLRLRGALSSLAAAICYLLALFSKETAITLIPVLLTYEVLFRDESGKTARAGSGVRTTRYLFLGAAVVLYLGFRMQAVPSRNVWTGFVGIGPLDRILTASRVLLEYLLLFVFPLRLSADYWKPEVPIASLTDPLALAALVILPAVAVLLIRYRRRAPAVVFSTAFFFLTMLPVSNLLFAIGVGKAERILYLPSIGFCLLAGCLYAWAEKRDDSKWVAAVPVAAVMLMSVRTFRRNADWKDNLTLARATLEVSPTSPLMNALAASEYRDRGEPQLAIGSLEEAIRERPAHAPYRWELGVTYAALGQTDRAIEEYREAIRLDPRDRAAHDDLAKAYLSRNQFQESIAEYQATLELDPNNPATHNNLGSAYLRAGMLAQALEQFEAAIALDGGYAIARFNRGAVYLQQGRLDEAVEELQAGLRIDPVSAEAHFNLGTAYLQKGTRQLAAEQYREALRLKPGWSEAANRLQATLQER